MVVSITTNTSALAVQKNLSKASEAVSSSLNKLSSGSRVPTAADDVASLALGSKIGAEIAGLEQASINASQATSLLQIADGALGEINDVLVRQKQLATQSASGQLSDSERAILDSEFQELAQEVDRIAGDTEFNGNQLINGGGQVVAATTALDGAGIEVVGADNYSAGSTVTVDYDNATFGSEKFTVVITDGTEITTVDVDASKVANGDSATLAVGDTGMEIVLDNFNVANAVSMGTESSTVVAGTDNRITSTALLDTAGVAVKGGTNFEPGTQVNINYDETASSETFNVEIVYADGTKTDVAVDATGIAASETGSLLVADTGLVIEMTAFDKTDATLNADQALEVKAGSTSSTSFDFKIGTGTAATDNIAVEVSGANNVALGTNGLSIASKDGADAAIDALGKGVDSLLDARANIGASLSRLEFASSNIAVAIENQTAAKSGLLDVDLATETTEFTSQQVIVQSSVSLLAQANQSPNQLLKLIG